MKTLAGTVTKELAMYPTSINQTHACTKYGSNGNQSSAFPRDGHHFKEGDLVKLIVNCNEWKLSYYLNDKQCGETVNIAKDITYYFAISINGHWTKSEFHIVSFDQNP